MITLVLMASGYGKRFGSNKLFYEIDGKAMYLHILEKLQGLSGKQIAGHMVRAAVISQYPEIMEMAERYGIDAVFNEDAAEGIAASVRLGVRAAEGITAVAGAEGRDTDEAVVTAGSGGIATGNPDWIVYFAADQPYLESRTIEGFISSAIYSGKSMASVCCGSEPGSPTMFQKCWYSELLALHGGLGGRGIMKKNPREIFWYEISAREIMDIDYRVQ